MPQKTCPKGHTFLKSSDCPTCPTCEAAKKPGRWALLQGVSQTATSRSARSARLDVALDLCA